MAKRGLVIGKFYPPHRGHKYLIDTALAHSDELTVIVCGKPHENPPAELRAAWLREIHPQARVLVIDDRYDENDSRVWAENTLGWLGGPPDVVFTSEDYGEPYSRFMGCRHVQVDKARQTVPCSGTQVRADPLACWKFLEPPVRAFYARRVCLVGAESTGTTTLTQALAEHYETSWVPEYGREYWAAKMERGEAEQWDEAEFVHIAAEQSRREDLSARQANRVLICDTDAFATGLWHERYRGSRSAAVEAIAAPRHYALYLLTGDEIPFVQDGFRDGEHIRHWMHTQFVAALEAQAKPYVLLRGSPAERLHRAIELIDPLLSLKS